MIEKFTISRDDSIYEAWPDVALTRTGRLVCAFTECLHHLDRVPAARLSPPGGGLAAGGTRPDHLPHAPGRQVRLGQTHPELPRRHRRPGVGAGPQLHRVEYPHHAARLRPLAGERHRLLGMGAVGGEAPASHLCIPLVWHGYRHAGRLSAMCRSGSPSCHPGRRGRDLRILRPVAAGAENPYAVCCAWSPVREQAASQHELPCDRANQALEKEGR